nr:CsbD family protein [Mycolicibacterium komanii]CRL71727.1 CsbD family protein [Mycolicibacterium komanii]
MTDHDKAGQAREGLIDSVKGKAKEMFGAITGNDSMTAEGQLQQAEAERRKEANTIEAVADAEAHDARTEVAEAKREGAEERAEVNAEAAAEKGTVESQKTAQKRAAEQAAHQELERERTQAELEAERKAREARIEQRAEVHDADTQLAGALEEHREAVEESASAKSEAARIRRQADNLNDNA